MSLDRRQTSLKIPTKNRLTGKYTVLQFEPAITGRTFSFPHFWKKWCQMSRCLLRMRYVVPVFVVSLFGAAALVRLPAALADPTHPTGHICWTTGCYNISIQDTQCDEGWCDGADPTQGNKCMPVTQSTGPCNESESPAITCTLYTCWKTPWGGRNCANYTYNQCPDPQ